MLPHASRICSSIHGDCTIVITVFGKVEYGTSGSKPLRSAFLSRSKAYRKLQCRVIEQLCRGGNNQHISSAYATLIVPTEVRGAVDNNHIIVMSDRFNARRMHQMRVEGSFPFIKFCPSVQFQCDAVPGQARLISRPGQQVGLSHNWHHPFTR